MEPGTPGVRHFGRCLCDHQFKPLIPLPLLGNIGRVLAEGSAGMTRFGPAAAVKATRRAGLTMPLGRSPQTAQTLLVVVVVVVVHSTSGPRPCPGPCLCFPASDLVDCRSRGLDRVPPSLPHGTWLLDLSGNRVKEVRPNSFAGLWSLKILLMSNNSIFALHPQSLSSQQFLERLDLSFNRLRWLPHDFSRSLSSLRELRLDHNLLQHLDASSLADSDNLRKLDLSYNRIQSVDARAFGSLSRLRVLGLQGNRLNALPDGLLTGQQALEALRLGHNNISVIEADALAPLRALTLLDLRGNRLVHVKFKTLLKLRTASTHLQMSGNPWTCDCELQRVFGKIQHVRHLRVEDYGDIVCHAPPQQSGASLASMDSQLCMAETVSVLVITVTVALAVVGALAKAERNRKSKQAVSDVDSEDK